MKLTEDSEIAAREAGAKLLNQGVFANIMNLDPMDFKTTPSVPTKTIEPEKSK